MEEKQIKQLEKEIKEEDGKANHKYVKLAWSIYKLCLKIERPNQKVTTTFAHTRDEVMQKKHSMII